MHAAPFLLVATLLAGCNRLPEETIDTVPQPTAESANSLMREAEKAAASAASRSAASPVVPPSEPTPSNRQGAMP